MSGPDSFPQPDAFVNTIAALTKVEAIIKSLSDIEGGLRTLGPGADKPSVSRIRIAARELLSQVTPLVDCILQLVALVQEREDKATGVPNLAWRKVTSEIEARILSRLTTRGLRK